MRLGIVVVCNRNEHPRSNEMRDGGDWSQTHLVGLSAMRSCFFMAIDYKLEVKSLNASTTKCWEGRGGGIVAEKHVLNMVIGGWRLARFSNPRLRQSRKVRSSGYLFGFVVKAQRDVIEPG